MAWMVLLLFLLGTPINALEEQTLPTASVAAETARRAGAAPIYEAERQQLLDLGYAVDSQEAYLSLYLNRRYMGELLVVVGRNSDIATFQYRDMQNLLVDKVPRAFLEELGESQDLNGWIPYRAIERYEPDFYLEELSLHLRTPADERDQRTIDFEERRQTDLSKARRPQPLSAYVNVRNLYSYAGEGGHYLLDLDGAVHCKQWVGEGRFDFDAERFRTFDFYELRAVRDYPKKLTRLTVGEDQSFRPRLLASDQIYGIKYSTEFSVQPFVVTSPISEYSFLLERDSLVTIWVNGEKQRKIRLPAGPFDIRNFPLTTGYNEVTVEVVDDLGNSEFLTFNAVSGPNLLAVGRSDFAYSIGRRGHGRTMTNTTIVSAFHRRGLRPDLTASLETRMDKEHQAIGGGIDFVTSWLYGSVDSAVSQKFSRIGGLSRIIFSRAFGKCFLSFRTDLQTRNFFQQNQLLGSARIKRTHTASLTGPMPRGMGTFNASFSEIRKWIGDPDRKGEVRWDKLFNSGWRVELSYLYQKYISPHHDYRFFVSYYQTGEKVSRSHSARVRQETQTIRSSLSGKQSQGWWASWKGTHNREWLKHGGHTDTLNGDIQHDANRCSGYYSFWIDDVGGDNLHRHNLNVSTAIAYVDGEVAVGRPIRDSFALVTIHPELGLDRLAVVRQGQVKSVASSFMGAIASDLGSYHPSEIDVEGEELEFEGQTFTVLPTYRSGVHIVAGSFEEGYGPLTVTGTLLDRDGQPVPYKAVMVIPDGGAEFAPLYTFTNELGHFRLPGAGLNRAYELVLVDERPIYYQMDPIEEATLGQTYEVGDLVPVDK